MAVDRSAEHRPGNRGRRRRQRRAARRLVAAAVRPRQPGLRAVGELDREQPAAGLRVQAAAAALRRVLERNVGQRHVDVLAVTRRPPLDPAELAAAADGGAPQPLAALIGIEPVHHAGFLPRHDQPLAVGQRDQNRRLAEVVIRSRLLGTVRGVRRAARHGVGVAGGHLRRPLDRAGVEVERHNRVGHRRHRQRVRVAGRDVQRLRDRVDGRRRPHGGTRRSPQLRPPGVPGARRRRLGDQVGPPDFITALRIERDDAAAERAAFVGCLPADPFFAGRQRHVQPSVVQDGRSGDPRGAVLVELLLPAQVTGDCVDAVDHRAQIAEVGRRVRGRIRSITDRDRRAHAAVGLECPVHAAVLQPQREHAPRSAADEHAIAGDGRIRGRGVLAVEPERPFQLQVRRLRGREAGLPLKSIVGRRHAPGAPVGG